MHKTVYKITLTLFLAFLTQGGANIWSTGVSAQPLQITTITQYVHNVRDWTSLSQHSIQVTCPPPPYGCW